MTTFSSPRPSLAQVLWPAKSNRALRAAVLVVTGTMLITLSAKIQIPFYPVPLTLQTMVILLLGMAYGGNLAMSTVVAYLAVGAMGLPVFAGTPEKGIGLAYMIGPTGGYLLGFLPAVAFCGALAKRGFDGAIWKVVVAMIGGNVIIYTVGLLWLGTVVGWDKPVLQWGLFPFLPAAALKIAIAAGALPLVSRFIRKIR